MNGDRFLKEDFIVSNYLPDNTDLEAVDEKNKEAIKQIYGFACMMNSAGREYAKEDIRQQAEIHYINIDKVEKIFKKVFEKYKNEFNIDNKPPIFKIEAFLKRNYNLSVNDITDDLMNGDKPQSINSIIIDLEKAGFKFSTERLKALLKDPKSTPRINPIKDYFNNIDTWDGVDHIKKFCSFIGTDDSVYFESMLKKHLVRSIECVLDDVYNRYVFVLSGEQQNIGKSSLINWLNPFGNDYYIQKLPPNEKDAAISIAENFFINLDELAGMSKYDINKIKQLISQAVVKERRPHAEQSTKMQRLASFWGTTNNSDFLIDSSNTRWLPFEINSIDYMGYIKAVDKHKLWGQVMHLYNSVLFESALDENELSKQDKNNKVFESEDIGKQVIKENFVLCEKDGDFYTTADIAKIITDPQYVGSLKVETRFINRIMRQIGFKSGIKK